MDKYRVKSFYYKSYSSAPEVRYKIQKRIMGFWGDVEGNFDTTNKEFMFRMCEELNIPYRDDNKSTYFIYVKQTPDQVEANLADLTVVNQKNHVIKHLQDAIFTFDNKLKIETE